MYCSKIVIFLFVFVCSYVSVRGETTCPDMFEGRRKIGRTWISLQRNRKCFSAYDWCVQIQSHNPVLVKSPTSRDGMSDGKLTTCADNDASEICVKMAASNSQCGMVRKISIGDGQEWHGNVTVCCWKPAKETPGVECYNNFELEDLDGEKWEKDIPNFNLKNCFSENDFCTTIEIQNTAVLKSKGQSDISLEGKISTCSRIFGRRLTNCDIIGEGCTTVRTLNLPGKQTLTGHFTVCCTTGHFGNRPRPKCKQNFALDKKNAQNKWQPIAPFLSQKQCVSDDEYCVKVEIEKTAIITSAREKDFEAKGKLSTCGRVFGSYFVSCDLIGEGCTMMDRLQIGEEGHFIEGKTKVCCCKEDFCNNQ